MSRYIPDEHERFRDEQAAERRRRDAEREPDALPVPDLAIGPSARRGAFQAGVVDSVNAAQGYTMRCQCPRCRGPVYVPTDSDAELVDCATPDCHVKLVTRRGIDGVSVIQVEQMSDDEMIALIAKLPDYEPPAGWQERVLAAIDKDRGAGHE
jgi:hypothetical protein